MRCEIGSDEAGKGDLFGPLVVAAAYVDDELMRKIKSKGIYITDSKRLTNASVISKAKQLAFVPHEIIVLMPKEYNKAYAKFKNLNKLLIEIHKKAIISLMKKTGCKNIVIDKFLYHVERLTIENAENVEIVERAESKSIAVAIAAIMARSTFLHKMDELSKKYGKLPLGSTHVRGALSEFVKRFGKEELKNVAKLHFNQIKSISNGKQTNIGNFVEG